MSAILAVNISMSLSPIVKYKAHDSLVISVLIRDFNVCDCAISVEPYYVGRATECLILSTSVGRLQGCGRN